MSIDRHLHADVHHDHRDHVASMRHRALARGHCCWCRALERCRLPSRRRRRRQLKNDRDGLTLHRRVDAEQMERDVAVDPAAAAVEDAS